VLLYLAAKRSTAAFFSVSHLAIYLTVYPSKQTWGGVLIWNPPGCSLGSKKIHETRKKMSSQVCGIDHFLASWKSQHSHMKKAALLSP
jgi:hypothetical protein